MKQFFCLISCVLFSSLLVAQPERFENEFKKSFSTKPKFEFKFDSRFSFLRNTEVKTTGVKIGLSFNRKFNLGLGINQLLISSESEIIQQNDTIPVNLNYWYFSPYFEYVYFSSKKWDFNLSTQIGIGEASFEHKDLEGVLQKNKRTTLISYEPAMLIDYKIVKWFGIGTGVGYRLILFKNGNITENFSSPVYVVKLKVYLGAIVRTFTGKEIPAE
ncbi:MAG: hypothetical protein RQ875_12560 [Vicingaceae bacterium]|nr:hypothetical protein [Vicingaceae bacterium]